MFQKRLLAILCLAFIAQPAWTQERSPRDRNVFAFSGRVLNTDMLGSLNVAGADYEDNYVTGIGYQRYFWRFRNSRIGYELGIAARYGDDSTVEGWGGLTARVDDIRLLKNLFLSPSLTFGLSGVDATHAGRERREEAHHGGDARLLFYLSPELGFRTSPDARYGVFWRVHHRSGAWKTLGGMEGATNANVFGLRAWF